MTNPLSSENRMQHLLALEDLTPNQISAILQRAEDFYHSHQPENNKRILVNRIIFNLFFENSTRTRSSFEVAAKWLGAEVVNFGIGTSSTQKGESLRDTVDNLGAMKADLFIIRHPSSGAANFLAKHLKTDAQIINAGDGCHQHPTQGLLDLFAIRYYKKKFTHLKVAIVGDILHSRVARSLIQGLHKMGVAQISAIGPRTLIPPSIESWGVEFTHRLEEGIENADVIVMLRLQKERMTSVYLPSEREYQMLYGITVDKLRYAKPDVIIMHPGPINRGLEISSEVADGPHSIILKQVSFGVAIRMAVMSLLLNPEDSP